MLEDEYIVSPHMPTGPNLFSGDDPAAADGLFSGDDNTAAGSLSTAHERSAAQAVLPRAVGAAAQLVFVAADVPTQLASQVSWEWRESTASTKSAPLKMSTEWVSNIDAVQMLVNLFVDNTFGGLRDLVLQRMHSIMVDHPSAYSSDAMQYKGPIAQMLQIAGSLPLQQLQLLLATLEVVVINVSAHEMWPLAEIKVLSELIVSGLPPGCEARFQVCMFVAKLVSMSTPSAKPSFRDMFREGLCLDALVEYFNVNYIQSQRRLEHSTTKDIIDSEGFQLSLIDLLLHGNDRNFECARAKLDVLCGLLPHAAIRVSALALIHRLALHVPAGAAGSVHLKADLHRMLQWGRGLVALQGPSAAMDHGAVATMQIEVLRTLTKVLSDVVAARLLFVDAGGLDTLLDCLHDLRGFFDGVPRVDAGRPTSLPPFETLPLAASGSSAEVVLSEAARDALREAITSAVTALAGGGGPSALWHAAGGHARPELMTDLFAALLTLMLTALRKNAAARVELARHSERLLAEVAGAAGASPSVRVVGFRGGPPCAGLGALNSQHEGLVIAFLLNMSIEQPVFTDLTVTRHSLASVARARARPAPQCDRPQCGLKHVVIYRWPAHAHCPQRPGARHTLPAFQWRNSAH